MTIEETIIQILNTLQDPFLQMNGQQLKLRYQIECIDSTIAIDITAGFPVAELKNHYKRLALDTLHHHFPDHTIQVHIHQFIKAHKTQLTGKGLRGIKNTIAVASGKGGVGKSTVTVNLAVSLAKLGARVGILDADIYGPSIPLMLGATEALQIREDHYLPVKAHGIEAMSIGYITGQEQPLIWRGPMLAKSLIQMLDCTFWDDLDYLFIDLPPGTGDIQLTLAQKIPLTAAIIVTTPQNIATLDAQKGLALFHKTGVDVLGIIENMAMYQCSQCSHQEAIFGEGGAQALCIKHHQTLLGQLPLNAKIRLHCDSGTPTAIQADPELLSIIDKIALTAAVTLAHRPINYADKFPPVVLATD